MDTNNKLDKLLHAARETKPVISFEEASEVVKSGSRAGGVFSSYVAKSMIALVSVLIISVAGYYFYSNSSNENTQPATATVAPSEQAPASKVTEQPAVAEPLPATSDAPAIEQPTAVEKTEPAEKIVAKPESGNAAEKVSEVRANTKRTVTISNASGTFALRFAGDDLKEMLLNNESVSQDKWGSYSDVITQAHETIGNHKTADTGSEDSGKNFMNDLKSQLIKDGLIDENFSSLQFNKDGLIINGTALNAATHKRYLDFYKQKTGKEIGATNFSIKGDQN
jgi:hypothetical protein